MITINVSVTLANTTLTLTILQYCRCSRCQDSLCRHLLALETFLCFNRLGGNSFFLQLRVQITPRYGKVIAKQGINKLFGSLDLSLLTDIDDGWRLPTGDRWTQGGRSPPRNAQTKSANGEKNCCITFL